MPISAGKRLSPRPLDVISGVVFPRQLLKRRLIATSAATIFCKVEFLMLVIFHADTVLRAPAISFSVDAMRCHRTWNIQPIAGFRMPWFASRAEGIGGIYAQANVEQGGAELEAALANYQGPVTHFPPAPPPEREELDLHDDERDFGAPPTPLLSRHDDNLHPEKHGHGPRGRHLHRRKGSQRPLSMTTPS